MAIPHGAARIGLVAGVVFATASRAQTSVSIGPVVGYYRPFGHFERASVYSTDLPMKPEDLSGPEFGGEVDAWFGRRVGASIEAGFASSSVPATVTPAGMRGPTAARVETAVAQALVSLPTSFREHLWLSAGVGVIRHAGTAYARYGSPSEGAGVIGAGAKADLNDHFSLTAGITTLWYMFNLPMPAELRLNPGSLERGRQMDAIFHLGARWSILPQHQARGFDGARESLSDDPPCATP